jgi:steroid delta-isomerase-like uncharacterized protein
MTTELRKLVDQHYDGMNAGDLDAALKGIASDVETVTPFGVITGLAGFRELGQAFLTAVPNQKMAIVNYLDAGDTAVVEGVYSGTHTGPLASPNGVIPATNREFSFTFADFFVAKDGKIVSHHIYWDNMGFMAQLGLIPS